MKLKNLKVLELRIKTHHTFRLFTSIGEEYLHESDFEIKD